MQLSGKAAQAPSSSKNHTKPLLKLAMLVLLAAGLIQPASADENLFGYVSGAETLPEGAVEVYQWFTQRADKGQGTYRALDSKTEVEFGVTNRFQVSAEINALSVNTSGLLIDGYLPKEKNSGLQLRSVELGLKYNFLSPALDDFGLAAQTSVEFGRLDPHSGQKKTEIEVETSLLAQKYFMEGQLVWVGNAGLRAAYERRHDLADLPDGFDWPTDPEMEISTKFGTGVSYRFAPGWYVGGELLHETEYETEIGKERWSLFGGPTIHWAGQKWWGTLTYFDQINGGGETYEGQSDLDLHLIEKTKHEIRLKIGYNF